MEFMKILRSIEEFLYEIMSWLVFYPRTMWRAVRHPIEMVSYSEGEMTDAPEEQYTDTLSPPLFLMLTVLVAHGVEFAFGQQTMDKGSLAGSELMDSEQNLLLTRSILFSIYPLIFAVTYLKHKGIALTRDALREPFFSQCYLSAPSALLTSFAAIMVRLEGEAFEVAGILTWLVAILWYIAIQTLWFEQELDRPRVKAVLLSIGKFIEAGLIASIFLFLIWKSA